MLSQESIAHYLKNSGTDAAPVVVFTATEARASEPKPRMTVAEWAEAFRVLPGKSSGEAGPYRCARTPYAVEPMEALSPLSGVQEVVAQCCTQIGKTEIGNNWFCAQVDMDPGPFLMVFPIEDLARKHSRLKLGPTIEESPRVAERMEVATGVIGALQKSFRGGELMMMGANSAAQFRNLTIRYLMLTDVDAFPFTVGEEGNPVDLAIRRTDQYSFRRKIFIESTPTVKGASHIEERFLESDQRYYHVPCPRCGTMQALVWGGPDEAHGIKFERDGHGLVVDVWYVCRWCGGRIDETEKQAMLEAGRWFAEKPHLSRVRRGYHLNALYSPWVTWEKVATEFMEAQGNPARLQVWTNTRMALTWEEPGTSLEWREVAERAGGYDLMEVPEECLLLVAGVDTQDDRLVATVLGFGRELKSWLIYHGELFGDPAEEEVWRQLDNMLLMGFAHPWGGVLSVMCAAVDAMGHRTQHVYNYCRVREPKVMAIRGATQRNKPVIGKPTRQDVNYQGEIVKNGVRLWPVGTDTIKSTLYANLRAESPRPGYMHFPRGLGDEFYKQLTAEKLVKRSVKGFEVSEWVKTRARNDALDTVVYAVAAAHRLGVSFMNWDDMERSITPDAVPATLKAKKRRVISSGVQPE